MRAPRFNNWVAKLPLLNVPQRLRVLDALHPAAGLDQVIALIGHVRAPGRCCPSPCAQACVFGARTAAPSTCKT